HVGDQIQLIVDAFPHILVEQDDKNPIFSLCCFKRNKNSHYFVFLCFPYVVSKGAFLDFPSFLNHVGFEILDLAWCCLQHHIFTAKTFSDLLGGKYGAQETPIICFKPVKEYEFIGFLCLTYFENSRSKTLQFLRVYDNCALDVQPGMYSKLTSV
ncbi:hypothetical protein ACJX0J_008449, partial [Zea mays]